MPLPRILFRRLSPITKRVAMTAGVKGPNLDTLPIVHFAVCGRCVVHTDVPAKGERDEAMGVAATKAGEDIAVLLADCR